MKMNIIFLVLLSIFSVFANAQSGLVERVVEVQTKEKNPATARSMLLNSASEKISEELIKEIIGEQKMTRNRSLIQTKIMKRSASYIPFSKAGDLKSLEEGFAMTVTVRANLDDLQKLLLENGLFYENEATPTILPVVRWVDRVNGRTFSWWTGSKDPSKAFLVKESRLLESSLRDSFLKSNFYSLRPQALHYEEMLSRSARPETLNLQNLSDWSQAWGAQMALQGQVDISKGDRSDSVNLEVRLTALQVMNGRVVAEVGRSYETESGPFEVVVDKKLKEILPVLASDLSAQVLEAWRQGSINSQLYRLRISGRLSLPGQESFKELLRNRVREVKSVRERLIEPTQLTYEMDSSLSPQDMAKKIGELDVAGTKLVVDRADAKELVLKVKR